VDGWFEEASKHLFGLVKVNQTENGIFRFENLGILISFLS